MLKDVDVTESLRSHLAKYESDAVCQAVSVEGGTITAPSYSGLYNTSQQIRDMILQDYISQPAFQLNAQGVTAGAAGVTLTSTPTTAIPGICFAHVYGAAVALFVPEGTTLAQTIVTITGVNDFGLAVTNAVTVAPSADQKAGGIMAVGLSFLFGHNINNVRHFTPLCYRPALSAGGGNLDAALNVVTAVDASCPNGVAVRVTYFTRGSLPVDSMFARQTAINERIRREWIDERAKEFSAA
jgi:hypothetical protein